MKRETEKKKVERDGAGERNPGSRPERGWMEGSYTIEASLVMSIALFFIAALLNGIFDVHSRVVGNFVLQEALERCVFPGNSESRDTKVHTLAQSEMEAHLNGFFGCGGAALRIEKDGTRKSGWVRTSVDTEISVKEYEPEDTLRLWAVLQAGMRREESGSSLQERDET